MNEYEFMKKIIDNCKGEPSWGYSKIEETWGVAAESLQPMFYLLKSKDYIFQTTEGIEITDKGIDACKKYFSK